MEGVVIAAAVAAAAHPLPYPLPANFTLGTCGDLPPSVVVPGCFAPVTLGRSNDDVINQILSTNLPH